jgi:hypothetical protein
LIPGLLDDVCSALLKRRQEFGWFNVTAPLDPAPLAALTPATPAGFERGRRDQPRARYPRSPASEVG